MMMDSLPKSDTGIKLDKDPSLNTVAPKKKPYVNKYYKGKIDEMFSDSGSSYIKMFNKIVGLSGPEKKGYMGILLYAVQLCAKNDRYMLLQYIMDKCYEHREYLTNTELWKCNALTHAAYRGNLRSFRILLISEGRLDYTNPYGESLLETLIKGKEESISKDPKNKIFIENRYDECIDFLQKRFKYKKLG